MGVIQSLGVAIAIGIAVFFGALAALQILEWITHMDAARLLSAVMFALVAASTAFIYDRMTERE